MHGKLYKDSTFRVKWPFLFSQVAKHTTKTANFVKIAQGIRLYWALVFWNLLKFSVFGALYPCLCTDGGEIWHGEVDLWCTHPCQISLQSVHDSLLNCANSNVPEKPWSFGQQVFKINLAHGASIQFIMLSMNTAHYQHLLYGDNDAITNGYYYMVQEKDAVTTDHQ